MFFLQDANALKITVVCDRNAISTLKTDWQNLYARSAEATPWQSWEWNEAWWRFFGKRKQARLLLFHSSCGTLQGIAPLCTAPYLGTPLRRLAWMGTGPSDYLGPLTAEGYEQEIAQLLLHHLHTQVTGWDIADLQQIRPDSAFYTEFCTQNHTPISMEPCPYLQLPEKWETLTAGLSKKMRSNIGYYERLLVRTFPDAEFYMASGQTLFEDIDAMIALHQKRWHARSLPGALGGTRIRQFHMLAAQRFLEADILRLHMLKIEGKPAAALYCFAGRGRTYYYLGGFDLQLSRYSPGILLTARAIRQAIEEKHREFDFLRGHEAYKYRWLPSERINQRLFLQRAHKSMPARLGTLLNKAEYYVTDNARAYAERKSASGSGTSQETTNSS